MIYVDKNLPSWKKFGLMPKDYHCPNCGKTFSTTIPFLTKRDAGMQSPVHGCGPTFVLYIGTPRLREDIEFYNKII